MANQRIGNLSNRWIGLSTDTKPTSGIPVGATYFEVNTGFLFIYNGYAWVPKPSPWQTVNYKLCAHQVLHARCHTRSSKVQR